jgi:hypothetical protein
MEAPVRSADEDMERLVGRAQITGTGTGHMICAQGMPAGSQQYRDGSDLQGGEQPVTTYHPGHAS